VHRSKSEDEAKRKYLAAGERKRDLYRHAVRIIREEGWENLTMARLAHRAGVSRQLVYQYVGNRDTLSLELAERFQDEVYQAVVSGIERHPDNYEAAMRNTLETFLIGLREERLAYTEMLAAQWPHPRLPVSVKEVRERLRQRMVDFWAGYFESTSGLSPRAASALSSFQYNGLHGLVIMVNSGQLDAEEAIEFFVTVLAAAVERLGGRVSITNSTVQGRES
jgi:AcrR family transcriptional regulator